MVAAGAGDPDVVRLLLAHPSARAALALRTTAAHEFWDAAIPSGTLPLEVAWIVGKSADVEALLAEAMATHGLPLPLRTTTTTTPPTTAADAMTTTTTTTTTTNTTAAAAEEDDEEDEEEEEEEEEAEKEKEATVKDSASSNGRK